MILSGTVVGFICVFALLAASLLIALRARFLSRLALTLFIMAFVGGVITTLMSGVTPRQENSMAPPPAMGQIPRSAGGPMAAIGRVDPEEFKMLRERVTADPKDVKARERLGHLYLQQQDYENVFRMAHEALQQNPHSGESRAHMGMVLFAMQQPDDALAQLEQALQSDPKNLEALLFKGIVQFQAKDDLKGAKETWDRYMKVAKPSDYGHTRVKMFLQNINDILKTSP